MWIIVVFVTAKCCTKSELSIMDWEKGGWPRWQQSPAELKFAMQNMLGTSEILWDPMRSSQSVNFLHISFTFHEFSMNFPVQWGSPLGQHGTTGSPSGTALPRWSHVWWWPIAGTRPAQGSDLHNSSIYIYSHVSCSFIYVHVVDCDCISTVGVAVKSVKHTHARTHTHIYIYCIYKIDTCAREGLLICWCMPLAPLHHKATCLAGLSDGTVGAPW